ncbi:MAG TPA: alpha/beta hydrolase, partial [Gemmatimonas sp.]|uniref:alpha/beta fold hydrolase n=1 Tax=Gemmatimonas sp. TaxID=1962908 RepID=UPI002ED8D56B
HQPPPFMPSSASTSLYYRVDGPPSAAPLMLLHGGPGAHHDYLYPQMLALAENHRVYTYDQRGGGQSKTDDPTPITWETQVADLGALIGEFGLVPPTLIGYSWGAMLAMLYAIRCTQDASLPAPARMVLISPAPITRAWRNQFEEALAARGRGEIIQGMRAELNASGLRERDPEAYRQRSFELSVAGYFRDPAKATALTPFRVTGKVQQSIWNSLGDFDLRDALCAVDCPVLVVHGNADPIPLESAAAAAECLGAQFVVLDACGHVPYVEQPEALFAALQTFLAETATR